MARAIASRPAVVSGTASPIPLPTLPDPPDIPHQTPAIRHTFSPARRYRFSPPFTIGRIFRTVDDVRDAVRAFVARYNAEWLIEKNGHRSPADMRAALQEQTFRRAA